MVMSIKVMILVPVPPRYLIYHCLRYCLRGQESFRQTTEALIVLNLPKILGLLFKILVSTSLNRT
jgi:hypothetical protein